MLDNGLPFSVLAPCSSLLTLEELVAAANKGFGVKF